MDYGLTYVDFIAHFFVFIMGLNYKLSYLKRLVNEGRKRTYLHFLRRYSLFLLLGLMISIKITEEGFQLRWGTLQYLGTSGLILLPLIELHPLIRLIIAIIFMSVHQYLLETSIGDQIYSGIEGGPQGMLSWASILILSSVLSEGFQKDKIKPYFFYGGLALMLMSIPTFFFWGFSRQRITLPFILLTIGTASLIFYCLYLIYERAEEKKNGNLLSMLGKNAFLLYMVHLLLVIFMFYVATINPPFFIVFLLSLMNTFIIWGFGGLFMQE
ncbi:MAG: hypothetical protein ACTSXH_13210 [Promethearchaeota archaeon]